MGTCALAHTVGQPLIPPSWVVNPSTLSGATSGVYVFNASAPASQINSFANQIYAVNGGTSAGACTQQFTDNRFAILFQPGSYPGTFINVGYYTSIAGLGTGPAGTQLADVTSPQNCGVDISPGALNTFWRSAENFTTTPTVQPIGAGLTAANIMVWATSQACPLRQLYVNGGLWLFQLGLPTYASTFCSGGFMADSTITDGSPTGTNTGGQQQFLMRNSDLGSSSGDGVWNYVYVGCNEAPIARCNGTTYPTIADGSNVTLTVIPATPVIAEKPFISYNSGASSYYLNIPQQQTNKVGTSIDSPPTVTQVSFANVYVTSPATDTAATINAQIAAGNHVVLSAGIYNLTESIVVGQTGACVIGVGFPTLIATNGAPCIKVTADKVRVGGVLLQAGPVATTTLLQWGNPGQSFTEGYLYDCFTRIGRFNPNSTAYNQADTSIVINSPNIIGDNLWLWRADHDAVDVGYTPQTGVNNGSNPSLQGLVVANTADNVTIYGLGTEHQLQDLVEWNGNNGHVYFFQAEYPYDAGVTYASQGYVAYRVGSDVSSHEGQGLGAYSNFWNTGVVPFSGFSVPPGIVLQHAMTRFLNNQGGIDHVVNNEGASVATGTVGPYPLCQSSSETVRVSPRNRSF